MSDTIPSEVIAIAKATYTEPIDDSEFHTVEISLGDLHRNQPTLATALHLWRVDLPGRDEIYDRRDREFSDGTIEPAYTNEIMSYFVRQNADGTYAIDGVLYDEDPE